MIITYFIALATLLIIDLIWLNVIARKLYTKELSKLIKKKLDLIPAIIFYALYTLGIIIFVINTASDWLNASLLGALFGLIAYSTYDLTNLSTLKNWPIKITVIDIIWGTTLTSITSTITYLIIQ